MRFFDNGCPNLHTHIRIFIRQHFLSMKTYVHCRHNFGDDIMHSCQNIEENRCFSNGGTNLHIHAIAQGRPEDNQVEFLQGPHGIVNPPKNLVLNNIRRFTMEHIGAANGL